MIDRWPELFRMDLARPGPSTEALVDDGRVWNYGELARGASEMKDRLRAAGVAPGDRVALLAPPTPEGVFLIHAMIDGGVVMVPLNLRLAEAELAFALELTRVRFLVVAQESRDLGSRLASAAGCGLLDLDSDRLELKASPVSRDPDRIAAERQTMRKAGVALILSTSGTSGRPKAALLSLANLRASAQSSIAFLGHRRGDRWLLCMPIYHIGGLSILIRSVLAGTAVVLHRRFDVVEVDRALEEDGITQVSLVATMLTRLLEHRGDRTAPRALRLVLLGGGPAAQSLLERAEALGYPIAPTYGLTEAASQVATRLPFDGSEERGDSDLAARLRPLPGVELRIVDAGGDPRPSGMVGEIEVRGPNVMIGYLDDPEATELAFRAGWLRTGDLGRLDSEGGLRVLDRRSDLIVSGGENIYPAEVESVLVSHPNIVDAGVIGRPDSEFGERPIAFVVERSPGTSDLFDYCRAHLAAFKVPIEVFVVEALPRTASGKLVRRELADLVPERSLP